MENRPPAQPRQEYPREVAPSLRRPQNLPVTHHSQLPRFFLEPGASPAAPALLASEAAHALTVLRLVPGDHLLALDGCGHAYPMVIRASDRRSLQLEALGNPITAPAPGSSKAALPDLEIAMPWPRPQRAEALVDRLTQLGIARIQPLLTARTGPHGSPGPGRLERLARVAQAACKQSGRLWLPHIAAARSLADLVSGADPATGDPPGQTPAPHADQPPIPGVLLDPAAAISLGTWARSLPNPPRLRVVLGPEGGLDAEETALIARAGLVPAVISPHILRVEAAAEAAAAILSDAFLAASSS